jgi:hypothetical protein
MYASNSGVTINDKVATARKEEVVAYFTAPSQTYFEWSWRTVRIIGGYSLKVEYSQL